MSNNTPHNKNNQCEKDYIDQLFENNPMLTMVLICAVFCIWYILKITNYAVFCCIGGN